MEASREEHLFAFASCFAFVSLAHVGATYLTRDWPLYHGGVVIKKVSRTRRIEAADRVALFPYLIVQNFTALYSCWVMCGSYEDRWLVHNEMNRWCMTLYCVKATFDVLLQLSTLGESEGKRTEIIIHHLVSVVAEGSCLWTGHAPFYGSLAVTSEVSTVFLNGVYAVKLFTGERTKTHRLLVTLNGVLLWFTYIAFRLVMFSGWLYMFLRDALTHDISHVSYFSIAIWIMSDVTMLSLSAYWFIPITKGLLKALRPSSSQQQNGKKKAT